MGFLERAIRRGVSQGVGNAVGKAIQQAVEPKATELANKTAEQIDQAAQATAQQTQQTVEAASGLEGALGDLQRSVEGYATEAAKNMKVCPACGNPTTAEKKFCPDCGAKLPEETVAQGAVCPSCGKQNAIGTKFCSDCGTKLPAAVQEEQATQAKDAAVMAEWDEKLPQYPKWCFGGRDFNIEEYDPDCYQFSARFTSDLTAQNAVKQYRGLLLQNGFRQAGEYPDPCHLYKMVDGACCHCDTEHCFDSGSDCPTIYFNIEEPPGGFNYVKPEPKKLTNFKDLFKF